MKKHLLIFLLPFLVGCGSNSSNNGNDNSSSSTFSSEPEKDLTPSIFNENMIHYLGRNVVKMSGENKIGVTFAMTCSGFEVKVNVTNEVNGVSVKLNSYAEQGGPWQFANVFIDGVEPEERLQLPNTTANYVIAQNLSLGTHYIRFVKLNEGAFTNVTLMDLAMSGATWCEWDIKYEKKIEFLGDSITCGYGTEGTISDPYSLEGQNGCHTYGYTCATDLGYEPSFCSQSGISIYMSAWATDVFFEDIYPTYDCVHEFDLKKWKTDIAVIALGTNDNTKFVGLSPSQQLVEIENILQKYKELCDLIKSNNPNCQFFFVYNLMLTQNGYIDSAIQGTCIYLNDNYGEGTAYRYEMMPNGQGSGGHPNATAQINDGHILAEFIQNPYDISE